MISANGICCHNKKWKEREESIFFLSKVKSNLGIITKIFTVHISNTNDICRLYRVLWQLVFIVDWCLLLIMDSTVDFTSPFCNTKSHIACVGNSSWNRFQKGVESLRIVPPACINYLAEVALNFLAILPQSTTTVKGFLQQIIAKY